MNKTRTLCELSGPMTASEAIQYVTRKWLKAYEVGRQSGAIDLFDVVEMLRQIAAEMDKKSE